LLAGLTPIAGDLATDFSCEVNMRLEVPEPEQQRYAKELDAALAAGGLPAFSYLMRLPIASPTFWMGPSGWRVISSSCTFGWPP
jgi:hypothetical protein